MHVVYILLCYGINRFTHILQAYYTSTGTDPVLENIPRIMYMVFILRSVVAWHYSIYPYPSGLLLHWHWEWPSAIKATVQNMGIKHPITAPPGTLTQLLPIIQRCQHHCPGKPQGSRWHLAATCELNPQNCTHVSQFSLCCVLMWFSSDQFYPY